MANHLFILVFNQHALLLQDLKIRLLKVIWRLMVQIEQNN